MLKKFFNIYLRISSVLSQKNLIVNYECKIDSNYQPPPPSSSPPISPALFKKNVIEYTLDQAEEYARNNGFKFLANALRWSLWNPHTGLEEPEEKVKQKQRKREHKVFFFFEKVNVPTS